MSINTIKMSLIYSNDKKDMPSGVLFLKDTHITDIPPSARQDDYQSTINGKLNSVINYANNNNLVISVCGDFFHRSNESTFVINNIIMILKKAKYKFIIIPGNHDMSSRVLSKKDALYTIKISDVAYVIEDENSELYYFDSVVDGKTIRVGIGGTPYGQDIPNIVNWDVNYGLWMTHHNFPFSYHYKEQAVSAFKSIQGVNEVFNGHLHHNSPDIINENTIYHNFGSMTRTKRDESERIPSFVVWTPNNECKIIYLKNDLTKHSFSLRGRTNAQKSSIIEAGESGKRFIEFLSNPNKEKLDINKEFDILLKSGQINKKTYDFLIDLSSIAKKEI